MKMPNYSTILSETVDEMLKDGSLPTPEELQKKATKAFLDTWDSITQAEKKKNDG